MAKVTSGRRLGDDEEPEKHIAAEGKRIIKEMVAQQLDTSLTFGAQQMRERAFVSGAPLDGSPAPCGAVSLDVFHTLQKRGELRLQLLGAGVSAKEADALLSDDKKKISEPESRARQQIWEEVTKKLQQAECQTDDQSPSQGSRLEKELIECAPATGIYAQLVQVGRRELLAPVIQSAGLPAEHLQKTEEDLFGHLRLPPAPAATSRKRRRARRIADSIQSDFQSDLPSVKARPTDDITGKQNAQQLRGSLWDVKEKVQQTSNRATAHKPSSSNVTQAQTTATKMRKNIGCDRQRLFTIKDGVIVELREKEVRALANEADPSSSEIPDESCRRMTVDEIRAVPKFWSYHPGAPNKVLFVKNLPPRLSESELLTIFAEFCPVECRVMTGKMKGQAFVTFSDEATAQRALDGVVGVMVEKKPIIIHFGRSQTGEKAGT